MYNYISLVRAFQYGSWSSHGMMIIYPHEFAILMTSSTDRTPVGKTWQLFCIEKELEIYCEPQSSSNWGKWLLYRLLLIRIL